MPYHWWLIGALVLAIGEMFTIGFLLGCMALGAAAAGVVAVFSPSVVGQWAAFTITSVGAGLLLRPLAMKWFHKPGSGVQSNTSALISQPAVILDPPDPVTGIGRVIVGGETWRSQLQAGVDASAALVKGSRAMIVGIHGATLTIEPAPAEGLPSHTESPLT